MHPVSVIALCRLHIRGNTRKIVRDLATLVADILDVDSVVDIAEARDSAGARHIVSGGCEIPPEAPEANVDTLTAYVLEEQH